MYVCSLFYTTNYNSFERGFKKRLNILCRFSFLFIKRTSKIVSKYNMYELLTMKSMTPLQIIKVYASQSHRISHLLFSTSCVVMKHQKIRVNLN